ncbi:hypothetical protein EfmAA290_23130 [Enterococcus faecium]|nr:hypothetical protein EfmAA290_23130 [Enterococcus faecium]
MREHDQYSRSPKADVLRFYDVLKKNGVNCVIRKEHGTDIDAACGQHKLTIIRDKNCGTKVPTRFFNYHKRSSFLN